MQKVAKQNISKFVNKFFYIYYGKFLDEIKSNKVEGVIPNNVSVVFNQAKFF